MISGLEHERLSYINRLMDDLHSDHLDIYESLCDREYSETRKAVCSLQEKLKSLSESLQDEI